MAGTSWRAVSVPTQKSNGDLPKGPGRVTPSPGRSDGEAARVITGAPSAARRASIGLIGENAQTADNAAFTIGASLGSGLIVDVHVRMKTWAAIGITHWWAAQGDHSISQDLAWAASIHPNGRPRLAISSDGINIIGNEATAAVPFPPGTEGWIRSTYANVFTAGIQTYAWSLNGINWTQLGDVINIGAYVQPKDSAQPILVPGTFAEPAQESVTFEVRVSAGAGATPLVANPRFDTMPVRQPSFTDDLGRLWTVNAPGVIGVA
jgi:hypothetical protein